MSDKQEFRKNVANIIADRKKFDEALKFQTGKNTIKKIKENIEHGLSGNRDQSFPDYKRTYSKGTRRFQMKNLYDKPTKFTSKAY